MKQYFDPPKMKKGALAIEQELRAFEAAFRKATDIVDSLDKDKWIDERSGFFQKCYHARVVPAGEKLSTAISDTAAFLQECSRRYGNVIDTGNDRLSS